MSDIAKLRQMPAGAQRRFVIDTLLALRQEQAKGAPAGSVKALERFDRITAALHCFELVTAKQEAAEVMATIKAVDEFEGVTQGMTEELNG